MRTRANRSATLSSHSFTRRRRNLGGSVSWLLGVVYLWVGVLAGSLAAAPSVDRGDEGWPVAEPTELGVDATRLTGGLDRIGELAGIRNVLVVRRGSVIAERALRADTEEPHNLKSASKSLLSVLVGIAIEKGWIDSLDTTVGELLPTYAESLPASKRAIRLRDLLSMRSGLATTSHEHYGAWVSTDDWTAAALARPLESEPGNRFEYSSGTTHLVSAILTEATGRTTLELAREVLLEPLGSTVHAWQRSPEGYYFGGNNLQMSPRDLAKLGQLYLQDGRWGDRQIVPSSWVEESTGRHAEGWPDRYGAYGYLWWLPPDDPWRSFAAVGYGGQFLYVVPELEMLVVVTSTVEGKGAAWDRKLFEILREHIFGAVVD